MSKHLFISTSNGVYMLDTDRNEVTCVLGKKHSKGLFSRQSKGYFGMCSYNTPNKILVSSRERLSLRKHNKPTTDTKLFEIDAQNLKSSLVATIPDVHDAHQICYLDHYVYITDTGKNRVVVYDIVGKKVAKYFNIGELRDDIHHINAILIDGNQLLVGLNNRGQESQILHINLDKALSAEGLEVNVGSFATSDTLNAVTHSHDLEFCEDMILCCSSHKGLVVNTHSGESLIHADMWVRGLVADDSSLWVGASFIASRKERHGKEVDGKIRQYSKVDWGLVNSFSLQGSGQVNDLILA